MQVRSNLESVWRGLLARMWVFVDETNDQIFNDYLTVDMAPLGPELPLGPDEMGGAGESLESPASICDPKRADVA